LKRFAPLLGVFDQTFFEKACVEPLDHAGKTFSIKPFLKRLALQQSLNQVQQLLNKLISVGRFVSFRKGKGFLSRI
jgi:hypothetical protein